MDNNMLLTLLPMLMGNQGGNPNADMFSKLMQAMGPGMSPPPPVPPMVPPKTCTIKRDDAHCYPPPPPPRPCPPPIRPCPPPAPPYPPCPPPPYPPCPPQPRPYNPDSYYPPRPYGGGYPYQQGPYQQNPYYNPYGSMYTQAKAEIPKEYQYPPLPAGDLSVDSVMGVFDMMTKKE